MYRKNCFSYSKRCYTRQHILSAGYPANCRRACDLGYLEEFVASSTLRNKLHRIAIHVRGTTSHNNVNPSHRGKIEHWRMSPFFMVPQASFTDSRHEWYLQECFWGETEALDWSRNFGVGGTWPDMHMLVHIYIKYAGCLSKKLPLYFMFVALHRKYSTTRAMKRNIIYIFQITTKARVICAAQKVE